MLPRGIAQDHARRRCGQILSRIKIAAHHGSDAQGVKEPIAHPNPGHRFGSGGRAQQVAASGVNIHRTEDLIEFLPIEIVRIGKVGARNHRNTFRDFHQPVGALVRQRFDQCGVDEAKDG